MSYVPLGSKVVKAVKDTTGLNPNNWTNVFDVGVLGAKVPVYEVYSIVVTQVPQGATLTAFVGSRQRSAALLAGSAEDDMAQPILMTPTDELFLCWNVAASGTAPVATVWLRYDPALAPPPITQEG